MSTFKIVKPITSATNIFKTVKSKGRTGTLNFAAVRNITRTIGKAPPPDVRGKTTDIILNNKNSDFTKIAKPITFHSFTQFQFPNSSPMLTEYKLADTVKKISFHNFSQSSTKAAELGAKKTSTTPMPTAEQKKTSELFESKPILGVGTNYNPSKLLFAEALQQSAEKYNCVISVRLPSELGQIHLGENFPTKNFHVKAKSSPTGPTGGLVAVDPALSKRPPSEWEKQAQDIDKALAAGALKIPLQLTERQQQSLVQLGAMTLESDGLYHASYHGFNYAFSIDTQGFVRYASGENTGKLVEVLSNPPEKPQTEERSQNFSDIKPVLNKPITADYDLFSLIPNKNHAENERPLQIGQKNLRLKKDIVKTIPEDALKLNATLRELEQIFTNNNTTRGWEAFTDSKGDIKQLDPNQGNFHTFGQTVIKDINRNASDSGYSGGKLVWHGDEMGNPASNGFNPDDAPVFFIPGHKPVQVTTKKELIELHNKLRTLDFKPETSLSFGV